MKFEKQNIFFISDLHIGHKNVIKFDNRPFTDVDEMHHTLIQNWNNVVGPDDIVYFLGDLSFSRDSLTKWFISSIQGKIYTICGNHDKMKDLIKLDRFEDVHEYGTEIDIKDDDSLQARGTQGYQKIILSHYPILRWNKSHYGSWMLHGHCHGNLIQSQQEYYKRKVIDVGCNCIDYTPISYGEVKAIMSNKSINGVDQNGDL